MKKIRLHSILFKSLALLSMMSCMSCEEDLESKDLKVYLVTSVGGNSLEATVTHPTSVGALAMKLPVRATRELVADANIEATINESLVATYNEEHETEYKLLPSSLVNLFGKVTLKEGFSESEDSIGIVCPDVTKMEEPGYVLPLTISNLSGADKGVSVSSNLSTVYMVIDVKEYRMFNATEPVGTLMDRSGWKITGVDGKNYPELLDGRSNTGLVDNGTELIVTIDLGKTTPVKGIRLTPRTSVMFDMDAIAVEVSANGQEWQSLKNLILQPASPTGHQSVAFYKIWSARYIKIRAYRVTSKIAGSVSEIDVWE